MLFREEMFTCDQFQTEMLGLLTQLEESKEYCAISYTIPGQCYKDIVTGRIQSVGKHWLHIETYSLHEHSNCLSLEDSEEEPKEELADKGESSSNKKIKKTKRLNTNAIYLPTRSVLEITTGDFCSLKRIEAFLEEKRKALNSDYNQPASELEPEKKEGTSKSSSLLDKLKQLFPSNIF